MRRLKLQSDHFSYPTALCIQGTSSICSVSYFILKHDRTTAPSPPPGVILPNATPRPVDSPAPLQCLFASQSPLGSPPQQRHHVKLIFMRYWIARSITAVRLHQQKRCKNGIYAKVLRIEWGWHHGDAPWALKLVPKNEQGRSPFACFLIHELLPKAFKFITPTERVAFLTCFPWSMRSLNDSCGSHRDFAEHNPVERGSGRISYRELASTKRLLSQASGTCM